MSIAHELSSEIAAAILSRKEEMSKLNELKEVVLQVHSVLQELTAECRKHEREWCLIAASQTRSPARQPYR